MPTVTVGIINASYCCHYHPSI